MALAIVYSRASSGIQAPLVTVETHLSNGMPGFHIVGLPEAAVKESRDRVRSALMNTQFEFPTRHITVNLAPADLPKEGGRFDLPIALGILAASGQLPRQQLKHYEFTGELALSGELRAVRGVLSMVLGAERANRTLIVPSMNAQEAGLVKEARVFSAAHLLDVCAHLKDNVPLKACQLDVKPTPLDILDIADVRGQPMARRALEIAAAGKHSVILMGPPGTGKTMLASRLSGLLPLLDDQAALEVAAVTSVSANGFDCNKWQQRPFRAPHHTTSSVALVGGGRPPRPGEISLAHHGILFLDELPEFSRHVLESLREPLESGAITISRAAFQMVFPARFQLIAAMNPCPCGYAGSPLRDCQCTDEQVRRYMNKISGPLLDRIDMQVEVPALPPEVLAHSETLSSENSASVSLRVMQAAKVQWSRQQKSNSELSVKELEVLACLEKSAEELLMQIMRKFNFSARVYHRIIKLARTIADLADSKAIESVHISEALTYRCLDRSKKIY